MTLTHEAAPFDEWSKSLASASNYGFWGGEETPANYLEEIHHLGR